MNEIRCIKCDKLLGKVEGSYEIQCTRCNDPKHIEIGSTFDNEYYYNGKPDLIKRTLRVATPLYDMIDILTDTLLLKEKIEGTLSLDEKRNKLNEKGYNITLDTETNKFEIIKDGKIIDKV